MKHKKITLSLAIATSILMMAQTHAGDIENTLPATTDAMTVKQGATELMRVQGDGKVGIGTATPSTLLDIVSSNRPAITLNNTSGNNRNSFINFKGTSGGVESNYSIFQWSAGQNLSISSNLTPGSTNIARFWGETGDVSIDNGELLSLGTGNNYFAGNVGIGITTPTEKLDISGNIMLNAFSVEGAGIFFRKGLGSESSQPDNLSITTFDQSSSGASFDSLSINANDGIRVRTNSGISSIDAMNIIKSGNVGIGTTTPVEKLDVAGNIKASGTVCDSTGCIGDAAGGKFVDGDTATDAVYMAGKVGIGTTNPSRDLSIIGVQSIQGDDLGVDYELLTSRNNISFANNLGTASYVSQYGKVQIFGLEQQELVLDLIGLMIW